MGWLSDLFSGGSSSSSSSSSNDDGPSPAPTPTVIPTGTTLKTGTVLNNDDDPVVFTPNDDGGFTGQNQSTLPAAEPETFGDAFAENRAAGNATFVYNGEVYTTDLAPETSSTPSVSYDAFGNAYDTPAAARQADLVAEAQAAAAQNAITAASNAALDPRGDQIQSPTSNGAGIASLGEDDVMSQTVVGTAGQDYADSLPDFNYDFTADDAGSPLPGDNVVADLSGYGNLSQADFISEAGPTAVDIVRRAPPKKYYDAFGNEFSTRDAAGESDRAAEAAAAAALARPQNPFVDDLLDVLAGNDRISQMFLPKSAPGYLANIGVGVATGAETAIRGAADLLDARPTTNMTLERMRDMGPMTAAEEEFMIRSAGEEGQRMRQEALGPRDQFFYDKTAGLTRAVDYMKDRYDTTIDNYEGNESIYKNIKSYEDARGYGPGQVDPALLDAMQSRQGIVDSLLFGQGPGSAVRMDGSGFDPSTATQKGIEAFGTTTPGLAAAVMGPAGFVAGTGYSFAQVKGELDKDTGAGIDAFYASGRLQQSPAFKSLIADGVSEADAVQTLKQRARDESAAFAGVLGGGATALEAGLLRTGAPGMLATPVIEALQEGPGESLASNQILGSVLGFDTPLSRAEILENMTAGGLGGGGAAAVAPLAGGSTQAAPVLDPSQFPGAGQPAQSNVPTSYDQTPGEELMLDQLPEDSMFGDSGMSGVGDITADARIMASEMLADQQIVFDADNNILTNKETNESFQIDPKVTPILDATTEIILGGTPAGARAVPTPVSAQTNVENLPAPGQDGPLGITFQGSRDLKSAVDQKLNEGSVVKRADGSVGPARTPVSLPAQNEGIAPKVDTTSAGKASIEVKRPSGIEEGLSSNNTAAIDKKMNADNAAPAVAEQRAAATSLSTIPTRVVVGDSLEGYSAADVSGQPVGSSTPQADLDVRGTTGGTFTNMKNEPIGSIDNAPYGEPVRRVIDNPDGTTTIQVGSRVSAEGAAGNRDNYVSAAVTLPSSATNEQKEAAYKEAVGNWKSNYEGATTSGDIERNAGKVVPNEDVTTFKAEEVITKKMDADNAATEVKLPVAEETAAVVTEKADGGAEVKLSDGSTSKTVVEKDGDSKTTRKTGAAVTETETGATVELPADQTAAEQVPVDQDVFAADQVEQEAAATAAEQAAADAASATETQTASTVAVSQVTDDGEEEDEDEEVEVEVEEEEVTGGDVTVDVDEDDTFVSVITSTDENGETITECPEGYVMVEGPDGPMCQKSVTTTVRRQRAGAGTRAYTGLSGNRGRVGPGQRRRINTTTTTETVDPTTRTA